MAVALQGPNLETHATKIFNQKFNPTSEHVKTIALMALSIIATIAACYLMYAGVSWVVASCTFASDKLPLGFCTALILTLPLGGIITTTCFAVNGALNEQKRRTKFHEMMSNTPNREELQKLWNQKLLLKSNPNFELCHEVMDSKDALNNMTNYELILMRAMLADDKNCPFFACEDFATAYRILKEAVMIARDPKCQEASAKKTFENAFNVPTWQRVTCIAISILFGVGTLVGAGFFLSYTMSNMVGPLIFILCMSTGFLPFWPLLAGIIIPLIILESLQQKLQIIDDKQKCQESQTQADFMQWWDKVNGAYTDKLDNLETSIQATQNLRPNESTNLRAYSRELTEKKAILNMRQNNLNKWKSAIEKRGDKMTSYERYLIYLTVKLLEKENSLSSLGDKEKFCEKVRTEIFSLFETS